MRNVIIVLLFAALLAACTPHKLKIQQGNIVSREKIEQLKPGMEASQVRFLLGSPLIQDPFNENRWDYAYSLETQGKLKRAYRLTLHFADNKLQRIEDEGAIPATEREAFEAATAEREKFRR